MKIAANAVAGFLKKPPEALRAVLFYGPDSGLARERLTDLALTVVPALDDPFLVCELAPDSLKGDPALLADEAAAIAMTGGRRVILLRDAGDGQAEVLTRFLDDPPGDALVLLTAGDLPAKSKLRKTFEAAKTGAAVPCYLDEAGGIDRLIDEGLKPLGVRIDREARHFLVDHLGSDRGISRSEIEKLALYAGRDGHLDLETVTTLIGDSSVSTLDDVVYAMADGDSAGLDRALELAAEEGMSPVPLLRGASNHMLRLKRVQDQIAVGTALQSAVQGLRPPVFFKVRSRFEAGVKRWAPGAVAEALGLLLQAEADCKSSGVPDWTLCHRTLHQVGALARRQAAARRRRA